MVADDIRLAIGIRMADDIVRARQAGRDAARTLGFSLTDQTRLATAISEITRNALHYGGGGQCEIKGGRVAGERLIDVIVTDAGPGIPDVAKAMTPGFSTGNSLGMGLPGASKLVDSLSVDTRPGMTQVAMRMLRRVVG